MILMPSAMAPSISRSSAPVNGCTRARVSRAHARARQPRAARRTKVHARATDARPQPTWRT